MNSTTESKQSTETILNPFKGPSTYEETDNERFYGRDNETNELLGLLGQNTLTLIYSKSGIGKSSLLKAGIIPILKKMNVYFPVYIRITDSLIGTGGRNFSEAIINLIKKAASDFGIAIMSNHLPEKPTLTDFIYLSNFDLLANKDILRPKLITPVLIFDQFEEIFSVEFHKASIKELLDDLSFLIESKIPKTLIHSFNLKNEEDEEELFVLKDKLQSSNKWYRIMFSFREEYLPLFESLKKQIPSIFFTNGRFHLEAFTKETATTVINKISKESIEINNETGIHLANLLSKTENENMILDDEVQPFLLSLVCKSLYPKIVGPETDQKTLQELAEEKVSLIDNIIADYATSVFKHISKKTKIFIENELITRDNKRTMYALGDLNDNTIRNELDILYSDSDLRYLNRGEYFNASHVEILHDRLLKPLVLSRTNRERGKITKNALIWSLSSIILLMIVLFLYFTEMKKISKYDDFFKAEAEMSLNNLKTKLQTDPLNSILPLISILDYENSIKSLPFFRTQIF